MLWTRNRHVECWCYPLHLTQWGSSGQSGIFRQILRGKLDFKSDPWPSISEAAKDLIYKMLEKSPKKRISAHEALCHPWIVDEHAAPDKPLDPAVLSRLKQFSQMDKIKKWPYG